MPSSRPFSAVILVVPQVFHLIAVMGIASTLQKFLAPPGEVATVEMAPTTENDLANDDAEVDPKNIMETHVPVYDAGVSLMEATISVWGKFGLRIMICGLGMLMILL